jgi:hypothetical protein
MQKNEVTTRRRETHTHARKRAQRKVTDGGGVAHVWEKYLTYEGLGFW